VTEYLAMILRQPGDGKLQKHRSLWYLGVGQLGGIDRRDLMESRQPFLVPAG
jgi:hypothetical protein